jgi:hypothetical protein
VRVRRERSSPAAGVVVAIGAVWPTIQAVYTWTVLEHDDDCAIAPRVSQRRQLR